VKALTLVQVEDMILSAMARNDWATVAELERKMARLDQPATPPPILNAALWYAQAGLHVFPLQARQKVPHFGTRGCKEATADMDQIRAWFRKWPDSNLGIATGHLVDVIDIDGQVGVKEWAEMETLPEVVGAVSTPRDGGTHLYVKPMGIGNKAGFMPGIDLRGDGGYVVAPPSVNAVGRNYRWRRPLDVARMKEQVAA